MCFVLSLLEDSGEVLLCVGFSVGDIMVIGIDVDFVFICYIV